MHKRNILKCSDLETTPPRQALQGYTVLRFWNNAVMNDMDSVIRAIMQTLDPVIDLHTES